MMIVAITHTTSRHTTSTGATTAETITALLMVLVVSVLAILCDILVAGDKKVINFKMSSIEKHVKYEPPELRLLIF